MQMIVILSTSNSISITFRIRYIIFRPDTIQKIYSLQSHFSYLDWFYRRSLCIRPSRPPRFAACCGWWCEPRPPARSRARSSWTHDPRGNRSLCTPCPRTSKPTTENTVNKVTTHTLSPHIHSYKDKWGHYLHFNPTHTHIQSKIKSILAISTIWNRHFVLSTSTTPPPKIFLT